MRQWQEEQGFSSHHRVSNGARQPAIEEARWWSSHIWVKLWERRRNSPSNNGGLFAALPMGGGAKKEQCKEVVSVCVGGELEN